MFVDDKKQGETQVELELWRQLLLAAADLLERDGWCQGVSRRGKSHCTVGAMTAIFYEWSNGPQGMKKYAAPHDKAFYNLQNSLPTAIATWNDDPGQNVTEVVAHLRKVAMA